MSKNLALPNRKATKILLVGAYAPSLINFRGPLIWDMIQAGYQVAVAAPEICDELNERLVALGASVHETPMQRTGRNMISDFRYALALRKIMVKVRPDIVLTYTIKPNIWGALAASWLGIPSVSMITGLGFAFTDGGGASLKRRFVQRIARWLYRAATNRNRRVIFQNPDDRDDFVAAGCLGDQSKIAMVNGSGVDLEYYRPSPLPPEPIFLMISRLLWTKGVREYAEASLTLRRTHPEARFLLVGPFDESPDGIERSELDRWIAEGLEYLGPLDDVRPAIAQARFYVLPSYREGTPRSVLEAMAAGRPIITTDTPGCRGTVQQGVNGVLVPPRDAAALESAMTEMIQMPREHIESMADASLAIARDRFDVKVVNRTMIEILGLETASVSP